MKKYFTTLFTALLTGALCLPAAGFEPHRRDTQKRQVIKAKKKKKPKQKASVREKAEQDAHQHQLDQSRRQFEEMQRAQQRGMQNQPRQSGPGQ